MHELICTKADTNRGLFHLDTFNFYSIIIVIAVKRIYTTYDNQYNQG